MSLAAALLSAATLLTNVPSAAYAADPPVVKTPEALTWGPITTLPPGAQLSVLEGPLDHQNAFIFRIKFAPGWKVPPHYHPVLTHVTVISGTFNIGFGEKFDQSATRALKPGSVVIMEPGEPHFAWVSEETVIQVHGIGPWGTIWADPTYDPAKG
jgi:quercetin dioxygenase-like cupin family protein